MAELQCASARPAHVCTHGMCISTQVQQKGLQGVGGGGGWGGGVPPGITRSRPHPPCREAVKVRVRTQGLEPPGCLGSLTLPLASCVILGELSRISVSQCPHLETRDNNATELRSSCKDHGVCPFRHTCKCPRTEPGKW